MADLRYQTHAPGQVGAILGIVRNWSPGWYSHFYHCHHNAIISIIIIIIIDNSKSQWTQGPTQCCPHSSGYPSSRVWALQVRLYKDNCADKDNDNDNDNDNGVWALQVRLYKDNCADNDHGDGAGSLYWSLVSILISPVPCVLILNVHSYSSLDSVK